MSVCVSVRVCVCVCVRLECVCDYFLTDPTLNCFFNASGEYVWMSVRYTIALLRGIRLSKGFTALRRSRAPQTLPGPSPASLISIPSHTAATHRWRVSGLL